MDALRKNQDGRWHPLFLRLLLEEHPEAFELRLRAFVEVAHHPAHAAELAGAPLERVGRGAREQGARGGAAPALVEAPPPAQRQQQQQQQQQFSPRFVHSLHAMAAQAVATLARARARRRALC
jgi:cytochrome P450